MCPKAAPDKTKPRRCGCARDRSGVFDQNHTEGAEGLPHRDVAQVDYRRLERVSTEKRLGSSFRATDDDREAAFALYE